MKRDLKWIEAFRTFGMLGVVFFHTSELALPESGGEGWWTIAISTSARFIVPAFFIVSGFLLRRSYTSTNRQLEFKPFWKGKAFSLIVPFLVWNLIYMLMYRFLEGQAILSWNTLFLLLTGYMQLYFVFVLIQFFFLYSLLHPHLSRRNLNYALIASAVGSFLFYISSEEILRVSGADQHFFEWHYGKLFIAWGLFFFWGVWLCDHFDLFKKLSRRLGVLGLATILTYALYFWELLREAQAYGYDARQYFMFSGLPFQFIAATFVLVPLYRLDQKGISGKAAGYVVNSGRDTFGIYLAHLLFLGCLLALWETIGLPEVYWLKVVIVFAATWFICQLLVRICRNPRLSFLNRFLFGGRK